MTTTTTQQRKIDSAQDEISGQTGFETINQNDFISNASMWYPTYREIIVENTTNSEFHRLLIQNLSYF